MIRASVSWLVSFGREGILVVSLKIAVVMKVAL